MTNTESTPSPLSEERVREAVSGILARGVPTVPRTAHGHRRYPGNFTDLDRWLANVRLPVPGDMTSCWIWDGSLLRGYGTYSTPHGTKRAHRYGYALIVGVIPEGLDLDHLCRNRACVNPLHLEPVTRAVNVLRGDGPTAANAAKTHCQNGHPLTPDNLMPLHHSRKTGRNCIVCQRAKEKRRTIRLAAERRRIRAARAEEVGRG